jgi:dCMP deaminase
MKERFKDFFMDMAVRTSWLSRATRLKVGSVIVKVDRIISIGYNGMPAGWDNECEEIQYMDSTGHEDAESMISQGWTFGADSTTASWTRRTTKPEVLHAESNAIAKMAKSTESSEGAVMFCTHAPCLQCAKLIYQSGIKELYFKDHYRDSAGLEFLNKSGISVTKR